MNTGHSVKQRDMNSAYEPSSEAAVAEVSVLRIANALLRRRAIVLLVPLLIALLAVGVKLILPRSFTTIASFAPQTGGQAGALQGLAAQFGIAASQGSDPTQQPMFFEKLAKTPELLRSVVAARYAIHNGQRADSVDLMSVFGVGGSNAQLAQQIAIDHLRGRISATTDAVTGVVRLEVSLPNAELSLGVMQRLLAAINDFNASYRREQAEAERQFTIEREAAARADLRHAEDDLSDFLLRNRQYQNDPRLNSEHDRLAREVAIHQDLFTSLAQHLQQSTLDAVRSTPVIHVIEHPVLPVRPSPRHLLLTAVLSLFCGLLAVALFVVTPELVAASGMEDPRAYETYLQLRASTAADIRRLRTPWRRLRQRS
jgi:Chain length determinant protein